MIATVISLSQQFTGSTRKNKTGSTRSNMIKKKNKQDKQDRLRRQDI